MKTIYLILLLCIAIISNSQVATFNLTVIDSSTSIPIEYASCIIKNIKSKKQLVQLSDTKGLVKFTDLNYGNYTLSINLVGYISIDTLQIDIDRPNIELTKYLKPNESSLAEVKIVEKRNAVVFDGDKTIVNVGSDIGNDGGNLKDVIQNAPGINIDNNNVISLLGKQGVKVLINGRESNRTKNMKTFLENLNASMIDKIEIMTNPPARYSAEGTAGIINIILKKGVEEFLYGSISGNINRFGSSGATIELGHSNDKYSINGSLNGRYDMGNGFGKSSLINKSIDSSYTQRSFEKSLWKGPYLNPNLNIDYNINEKNSLSASFGYEADWHKGISEEYDSFFNSMNQPLLLVSRYTIGKGFSQTYTSSLSYEKVLKNEDENINASISFEKSNNVYGNTYTDDAIGQNEYYKSRKYKSIDNDYNIDSRLELNKNIDSNWSITSGYQCTYDYIKNNAKIYQDYQLNNDFVKNNENNFLFDQFVNSLYTTINGRYDMFKLNAGIRFEHTYNKGVSNGKDFKNAYYGFYPNVSITSKFNKSNSLTFSYNRRLMRPMVWMLQENVFSTDDRNIWSGNTSLKPSISNSYNLSYNYNKNKWTVNVNLSFSDNYNNIAWNQVNVIKGVIYRGYGNFGESKNIGSYIYLNYKPFKSWDITGSVYTGFNIINKSTSVVVTKKSVFNTNFSLKNQWKIKKHIIIHSDMWYMPKLRTNTGYNVNIFNFDLAFKLLLLKSKLGITLSGENITNTGNWGNTFIGDDFITSSQWFYNRPNVQLTIIYHFGKDKKEDESISKSNGGGKGGGMGGGN